DETETPDGRSHQIRLSSSEAGVESNLIDNIASLLKPVKPLFTVATCSAAIVAEGHEAALDEVKSFMGLDYGLSADTDIACFQKAVHGRLSKVTDKLWAGKNKHPLRIVRNASDLPLTCVYLRFTKPIITKGRGAHLRVQELLATGIYEPSHAVENLCPDGRDLNIPTQILLAKKVKPEVVTQLSNLRETYKNAVTNFRETHGKGVGRIFVAYHNSPDKKIGKEVVSQLTERLGHRYDVHDGMVSASPGRVLIDKFTKIANRCDYSISILPKTLPGANVAFEHGYFFKRLGAERAFLVGHKTALPGLFSDDSGRIHIHRSDKRTPEAEARHIVNQVLLTIPE
ncbi:MAG: hypothetical protein U1F77_17790, partial [Kiritimatiellia bacterium]